MANNTIFRSSGKVVTLLGNYNMSSNFVGDLTYLVMPETTLDSHYGIHLDAIRSVPTYPQLRYFGIGVKGYHNTDTNTGRSINVPTADRMNLYRQIPFRCVPVEQDLTWAEREKYRFRVVETINGTQYACYYLKKITYSPAKASFIKKDASGVEDVLMLDPTKGFTDEPPSIQVGGLATSNLITGLTRVTGNCIVEGKEIAEAAAIKYSNDDVAFVISECGYYTGCEWWVDDNETLLGEVSVTGRPASAVGREAVYVQLAAMECTLGDDLSDPASSINLKIAFENSSLITE